MATAAILILALHQMLVLSALLLSPLPTYPYIALPHAAALPCSSGDTSTAVLNLVAMSRIRWQREADKAVARLKVRAKLQWHSAGVVGSSRFTF